MEYIRTALFLPLSVPSTRYIFHQIFLIYVPQANDCQSLEMIVNPCIELQSTQNHGTTIPSLMNFVTYLSILVQKNTCREASSSLHLFFFLVRCLLRLCFHVLQPTTGHLNNKFCSPLLPLSFSHC